MAGHCNTDSEVPGSLLFASLSSSNGNKMSACLLGTHGKSNLSPRNSV